MSDSPPRRPASPHPILKSTVAIVVLFGAFAVLPFRGDHWWVGAVVGAGIVGAVVPLAIRRLRRVLHSERPIAEAAEAVLLLVSMLITGFAAVFYAMNRNGHQLSGLDTRLDAIYFTVTTLGTVGYGDITATSQWARAVVTVQMVFDLLFLGIAVRVFSSTAQRSAEARNEGGAS